MIGVIADDFTGATDVAVAFRRAGLQTAIMFALPVDSLDLPAADVIVVALKTRTIAPADAVEQSLRAARWLRERGATQLYFKICSTFDSTPSGNIGPVADALADLVGATVTAVVPSSPEHERRQCFGNLFVGAELLSDSPMRHHPLTPMTDSFIPRVLQRQTERQVGLLDIRTVLEGREEVARSFAAAALKGERYVVIDSLSGTDLAAIGAAIADSPLVVGAAGLASGLGRAVARGSDVLGIDETPDSVGAVHAVALAGSCSARTLEQVEAMRAVAPSHRLDALATPDAESLAAGALQWFDSLADSSTALIYSSVPPEQLRAVQAALGTEQASTMLESALAIVARGLTDRGVRRLVVAGGETSGAVVAALGIGGGLIGEEVAPGVPWIYTDDDSALAVLLKSGNFGGPDLLVQATRGAVS